MADDPGVEVNVTIEPAGDFQIITQVLGSSPYIHITGEELEDGGVVFEVQAGGGTTLADIKSVCQVIVDAINAAQESPGSIRESDEGEGS